MRRCRAYSGLDGEHFVSGGKALQPALLMGLPGWPSHTYNKPVTPDIIVRTAGPDWSVRSRAGPATLVGTGDVAAGANAVIGHLIDGVLARRPKLIGLHAAGTQIGDGAVLFTGDSGAGKSSLVLHLARRGYRCLADDQILVDLAGPPQVVALGLALKARLPLPPGDALARFVTARVASADDASAYLHLRREEAAPFATGLPLTAIIVVRRGLGQAATAGGGGGDMAPLSPGGAVACLMEQATAPGKSAAELIGILSGLSDVVPMAALTLTDSDRAARQIVATFGAGDGPVRGLRR